MFCLSRCWERDCAWMFWCVRPEAAGSTSGCRDGRHRDGTARESGHGVGSSGRFLVPRLSGNNKKHQKLLIYYCNYAKYPFMFTSCLSANQQPWLVGKDLNLLQSRSLIGCSICHSHESVSALVCDCLLKLSLNVALKLALN